MLDFTHGGRCIGGEDAVRFFEMLSDMIPDETKTEKFRNEYEYALNRVRCEVRNSVPIAPKTHKQKFTTYTCGQCGAGVEYATDRFCPNCGRAIDWREIWGKK